MIDVKETLMEAEEQMEMAAMYLDPSLRFALAEPMWL